MVRHGRLIFITTDMPLLRLGMKPPGKHCGSHHASERQQRGLDLRHVAALKQVIGLKDVVRLQAVLGDGLDEIG